MSKRPKRSIKPPSNLKEYVIAAETEGEDDKEILKQKSELLKVESETPKLLKCKKFDILHKKRTHTKKHEGKNRFLCEECGKSLSSYQAFTEHMNIHENFKPYKCEVCGHESRQLSVHSRHMLVHEQHHGHLFKCSVCARNFRQKQYLKQHVQRHLGKKAYRCDKCAKCFIAKTELNRHQTSHSSNRPFSCPHCDRKFKLKHNLNAHIRSHTGIQHWKCCLCKASFPQQCLMEKHKRMHTELIQHLELVKTDERTLTITSFPLDRRKVAHQQNVTLPPKLDLNDPQNDSNTKVSLALNDAFIPISVIANSFGTGNYLKMKIVDQINLCAKSKIKKHPVPTNVTDAVIVNEGAVMQEGDFEHRDEIEADASLDSGEKSCIDEDKSELDHATHSETDEPEALKFQTHFDSFEKVFSSNYLDEDKMTWLRSLKHIVQNLGFPLHYSICSCLHAITTKLQTILILNCTANSKNSSSKYGINDPSREVCSPTPSSLNSLNFTGEKTNIILTESLSPQSFNVKMSTKDDLNNAENVKIRVMLCESIKEDKLLRQRLKEAHKFYLVLSKILHKHLNMIFE